MSQIDFAGTWYFIHGHPPREPPSRTARAAVAMTASAPTRAAVTVADPSIPPFPQGAGQIGTKPRSVCWIFALREGLFAQMIYLESAHRRPMNQYKAVHNVGPVGCVWITRISHSALFLTASSQLKSS